MADPATAAMERAISRRFIRDISVRDASGFYVIRENGFLTTTTKVPALLK
jgi:hypothetical protein